MKSSTDNQAFLPQRHGDTVRKKSFWMGFLCASVPLWLLVFAAGARAEGDKPKDPTVEEISQKVEEAQSSVADVRMDLNMDMKDSLSGNTQNVKGVIQIKSPDKVYVHYTKPEEQFLYVGEGLMQMYQPSQKTVYQQHGGKGKDSGPMYLGVGKELKKYIQISRVSIIKNSADEVGLLFIPLVDDAGFDKMRVYIHKKDWWPYQMEVETPATVTKARFSNFAFNQGLKDGLFEFTPPKGAQVVEGAVF